MLAEGAVLSSWDKEEMGGKEGQVEKLQVSEGVEGMSVLLPWYSNCFSHPCEQITDQNNPRDHLFRLTV